MSSRRELVRAHAPPPRSFLTGHFGQLNPSKSPCRKQLERSWSFLTTCERIPPHSCGGGCHRYGIKVEAVEQLRGKIL